MIIGLTGGIASGKSLVTAYLQDFGIPIIDTDEIARQVVAPGQPAWHRLKASFGDDYFLADGALHREALARLVFQDSVARQQLESITHPAIYAEVERRIGDLLQAQSPPDIIVVSVPLLFETGAQARFDATILVSAPVAEQRARLQRDRGYTREEADARIAAQWPLDEKTACATYVLDNTGTPADLRQRVRSLLDQLRDT